MRRFIRALLAMAVILAVVTGCGKGRSRVLTVYTYASFPASLVQEIQQHFQKEYNVRVDVKTFGDTGPMVNRLIREKSSPKADVVIGLDNNYLFRVKKLGILQPYRPKALPRLREELLFDPDLQLIPYDFGYIVFNYDSKTVSPVPQTHRDLLKPAYKDAIVVQSPLSSSPGQAFLLATIALFGEDGYLEYWRGLKQNGVFVAPGWDEAYGMFTNGERAIVLSYGTSPVYHLIYEKSEQYKALVLDGAAYAQIEGAGIVKGSPQPKLAAALLEYLLSKDFQEKLPEAQFMYPAVKDAKLPASFRVAAKVDRLLNLPPEQVAAKLNRWLADWEKTMQ